MTTAVARTPKIAHAHNHGHGNIGDDAMAENIYKKLKDIDCDLYTVSTYRPPRDAPLAKDVVSLSKICFNYDSIIKKCFFVCCDRLKLNWLKRNYIIAECKFFSFGAEIYNRLNIVIFISKNRRLLLRRLSDVDFYIRSGSGSINDIWHDSSVVLQYYESLVCKSFGAKILFTGQGIGPVSNWRWNRVICLAKNVDFMTFRDCGVSERLLREQGVQGPQYKSVGDDAFDIAFEPADFRNHGVDTIADRARIICLQFRVTDYENPYASSFWPVVGGLLRKIDAAVDNVFFAFLPMSHGGINDERAGEFIRSEYGGSNYAILRGKFSASEAKGIIAASQLAIGQSYHFGVFALSGNVPFIGVYTNDYYKMKNEGLLRWYDRGQWAFPLEAIDETAETAAEIFRDWDEHVAKLRSTNSGIQKNLNHFYDKFLPRLIQGDSVEL